MASKVRGDKLLAEEERNNIPIPTLCAELDKLLGGGIRAGTLTEVAGTNGVGRTTLALQLCLNVQIPKCLNGSDASALYINTDRSYSPHRFRQMTKAFVTRCNGILTSKRGLLGEQPKLVAQSVMRRVKMVHFPLDGMNAFAATVLGLDNYLMKQKGEGNEFKIIIIDTIFHPFITQEDELKRTKSLFEIGMILYKIIHKYNLAIVVTNAVTNKYLTDTWADGTLKDFIPCLGEAFNYVPNQILQCSYNDHDPQGKSTNRSAELIKSAFANPGKAQYRIVPDGIRD